VNGYRFESHVVARSKKFWLLLPAAIEAGAKVGVGETVAVKLQPEKAEET
jgi:predicted RecA/RadA family phage recombinase